VKVELSESEQSVLVEVLERELGELRVEIRRTSERAFHDTLVAKEGVVRELLDRLRAAEA